MNSFSPLSRELDSKAICEVFNGLFHAPFNTTLLGGADEPLYLPASATPQDDCGASSCALLYFRADYSASALHEVAHWCIAGPRRRLLPDYGYWYDPDGRCGDSQAAFLSVERRPQALEWCFSQAAGLRFRLSLDNLDAPPDPSETWRFACAVADEVARLSVEGLPGRAALFFRALARRRGMQLDPAALCCEVDTLL